MSEAWLRAKPQKVLARHRHQRRRSGPDRCEVAQIAKSIVFEGQSCAIIVITSGANKVDRKKKLKAILGYKPKIATPGYVWVRPGSHRAEFPLRTQEQVSDTHGSGPNGIRGGLGAAAGSSETVFPIPPDLLASISSARIADVRL